MSHDEVPALDLVPLLDHIATALASVRDEAALVAAMGDIMQRIIDVEYVAVFFLDRSTSRLRHVFARGFTEEERLEAERTAMDRHVGDVFCSQQVFHVPEVAIESDPSAQLSPRRHTVRSRLTLPLVGRGQSVGAISLGSTRPESFTQTHITLLSSVASLAGVVYWNLEDLKTLEAQLALTRAQKEELRRLSTPLLEIAPGVLLLPLVGRMDTARADQIADRLLSAVSQRATRAALIDVTGVEAMDAASVSALAAITRATKLLGAECMLSGISPASAVQMTEHDIHLDGVSTFSSASNALVAAMRRS
ncbi:RsbR, positive regulator of sigma-B [Labilithrix luteola]|uniref:RsbR, positive regulator of sigma-B n=1 Tax=Labilithrix luteola TaxID=1391654 RepID=A0A0K1PQ54_9BACT|nr:GAF domain-containing protein [Labilithrix luteola]AKU95516.1 RsbR, positive regulator of sigma-B [Labilithrix luteola]